MPFATITAIDYHLPGQVLTNEQLAHEFPEWDVEKIAAKTGIRARHIAAEGELSSDLAFQAATKLMARGSVSPDEIDFLLFCTQTADYALPTSACLLQARLGLPTRAGALDFNLGCSGYVYGLGLCKGLIESGQARNVLFLTGETYSKLLARSDKSLRTIFGDAGAATLVQAKERPGAIGPVTYGTDGRGGGNLICHSGGFRGNRDGLAAGREALWMNGPEIFNFTLDAVPQVIADTLGQASISASEVDLFVFHQANLYMLDYLRRKMGLPPEKCVFALENFGNTVSCTIPIALREAADRGQLKPGMRVMLVGFGVGYSWAAALIRW